jgi:nucleoside-diphosphate-sugar epimerase
MHTLLAGCGDVGCRLGLLLSSDGHRVSGLRRTATGMPAAITPLAADLTRPETLRFGEIRFDQVVFLPAPDARLEDAYISVYRDGLQNLRRALADFDGRFIAVVYGQQDGSWVNEETQPDPTAFNGRVLLEMERDAARLFRNCTVVRFSGIYGPGRDRLIRMATGQHAATGPPTWTNRIHADDAAGVLHHILKLKKPDDLYLASDDLPVLLHDVLNWLAVELGLPDSARVIPVGQAKGRRIDASRLRHSAYHMHYPDYRSGYRSMLAEDQND